MSNGFEDYIPEGIDGGHYIPGVTGENDGRRAMVDRCTPAAVAGVLAGQFGRNPDGSLLSGVDVIDPVTGGAKGMKPERYGLIPVWPLAELARVYGYGAQKYDDNNWRKGYRWGLSYDALQRHVNAFWSGESIDPESGFHHLAHAAFHLFALMTYEREGAGTDDRAK